MTAASTTIATTTTTTNGKGREPAHAHAAHAAHTTHAPDVRNLSIGLIDESPTNPRKTFADVEDLAADIKVHGVLQPVLVRPHPKKTGRFELVFGARRFRGSKIAKLETIPAMVRELDDAKVLEIQIVENSKRSDIHPLEEADGYRALHEKHGYSVEEIAAKVGKPVSTIYGRLKLCTLTSAARKAFFEGKLTAASALVLARIPHEDLQKKALEEVLQYGGDDDAVSARDALHIVRRRFMLRLVEAPFDRTDTKLVAGAPACAACPKRTGNQRELFSDVDGNEKDDLCTDPKCFEQKKEADWAKRKADAEAKGVKVLSEKETKKVFGGYGAGTVDTKSGYVDLAQKRYDDPKQRTNAQLLGKKADVPVVLARDEYGKVHELVAEDDFKKAAKNAGVKLSTGTSSSIDESEKKRRQQEAKKREQFRLDLSELVTRFEKRQPNDAFWRTLARGLVRIVWSDSRRDVCARRSIEVPKDGSNETALLKAVDAMSGDEARGLCVEFACVSARGDAAAAFREFKQLLGPKTKSKPMKSTRTNPTKAKAKAKSTGAKRA